MEREYVNKYIHIWIVYFLFIGAPIATVFFHLRGSASKSRSAMGGGVKILECSYILHSIWGGKDVARFAKQIWRNLRRRKFRNCLDEVDTQKEICLTVWYVLHFDRFSTDDCWREWTEFEVPAISETQHAASWKLKVYTCQPKPYSSF